MKYSPHLYARAFSELIAQAKNNVEEERLAKNFIGVVLKNGDGQWLKKILARTEEALRRKSGRRKVTVESARPISHLLREITKLAARPEDTVEEKVNPELVAGVKITMNDEEQLDFSLARKLKKLFP